MKDVFQERREFEESLNGEHIVDGEPENGVKKVTFTLKRSGKVIRRLSAGKFTAIYKIYKHASLSCFCL